MIICGCPFCSDQFFGDIKAHFFIAEGSRGTGRDQELYYIEVIPQLLGGINLLENSILILSCFDVKVRDLTNLTISIWSLSLVHVVLTRITARSP